MSKKFSREQRLRNAADFRRVFTDPLKAADGCFTVLAARHTVNCSARLGLAIAKKQLRRAVDRNRVKRLVREYFRCHVPQDCGMDFVVLTRATSRRRSNAQLTQSLDSLFCRLLNKNHA